MSYQFDSTISKLYGNIDRIKILIVRKYFVEILLFSIEFLLENFPFEKYCFGKCFNKEYLNEIYRKCLFNLALEY